MSWYSSAMLEKCCQVFRLWCCASLLQCSTAVSGEKAHRCVGTDKQGCLHLNPQSSSGVLRLNRFSGFGAVHLCCHAAQLCLVKKLTGVLALTTKAVFIRAALVY